MKEKTKFLLSLCTTFALLFCGAIFDNILPIFVLASTITAVMAMVYLRKDIKLMQEKFEEKQE